jgi:small subunit ribosomal protein S10
MTETERIRIRMEAYDHRAIDSSAKEIIEQTRRTNAHVSGLMPTQIEHYTALRSLHVDKKSREQFEMRTHKRLIDIYDAKTRTIKFLTLLFYFPCGAFLLRSRRVAR